MYKVIDPFYYRKNLLRLILWLALGTLVGLIVLGRFLPKEESVSWFPVIPLFFGVMGYVFVRVLKSCFPHQEKNLVNVYLLVRVAKIFCTIALVVVYIVFLQVPLPFFLFSIAAFYIVHLIWETRFFFSYEKRLKNIRNDENTN